MQVGNPKPQELTVASVRGHFAVPIDLYFKEMLAEVPEWKRRAKEVSPRCLAKVTELEGAICKGIEENEIHEVLLPQPVVLAAPCLHAPHCWRG